MADDNAEQKVPRKRAFRVYSYRGISVEKLVMMSDADVLPLYGARARRKINRGLKEGELLLQRKIKRSKLAARSELGEKPEPVRTHLRNAIIVPSMVGGVVAVYNGKSFTQVEIKADMIGHYLGEFSITYKPVQHNRPGVGATHSSRFIPLR